MRLIFALVVFGGQIAFTHAQDGEPLPFGRLVDTFPKIHLKATEGFDCPLIDGGYAPEADTVDFRNSDGQHTVERKRRKSAVYFVHPRVTRNNRDEIVKFDSGKLGSAIQVKVSDGRLIEILAPSVSKRGVESVVLDANKGDFRCQSGMVIYKTPKSGGSGEGGSAETYSVIAIAAGEDGSLLYWQYWTLKQSGLFQRTSMTRLETYYRYPRM